MVSSQHTGTSFVGAAWRYTEIFFSAFTGMLLWIYAFVLVVVWYGARLTPEPAVLVRIASSILSDLVWIPLGFIMWTGVLTWLLDRLLMKKHLSLRILAKAAITPLVVLFFAWSFEIPFKFLFIALILYAFKLLYSLINSRSRKLAFFSALPLCFIMVLTGNYYRWQLVPTVSPQAKTGDIKIMGYNILAYASYDDRMKVFDTIKKESPDVICFMEFNPMRDPELFKRELGDRYPYTLMGENPTRWTRSAACILSRFPLNRITTEKISEKNDRYINFIFAEMNVNGKIVNIVNYHLITVGHRIARAAQKSLNSSELVNSAARKEEAFDTEKYNQVHYLIDIISTFREPTILCGDLNDTPNSRAYHLLDRYFVNTFSGEGWGLGSTFGKTWMLSRLNLVPGITFIARDVMRIDHIFVSRNFTVVSSDVIEDAGGSDHRPVVSVLRLREY